MKNINNNRIVYLDILRILAILAVITMHVSSVKWYVTSPISYEWNVYNFYDSIARWAVPVFVMISGAIFLDNNKEINIKKLFFKNILRIITAFLFWSLFYILVHYKSIENINDFIEKLILGHYHLWFLYMIIGLYIITPFLRKITEDEDLTKLFLIITFIFTILLPTLSQLPCLSILNTILSRTNLNMKYITYFVLGYYLNTKEITLENRKLIYLLSFLGFLTTIVGSSIIANYKMEPYGLYNEFLLNVFFESIGIFLIIKNLSIHIKIKYKKLIDILSLNSFGIYLIHDFIIEILQKNNIPPLTSHPLFSIPLLIILTYIISLVISIFIHKIPILKKYIV